MLTAHKHGFEKAATALKIPSRSQKKLVLTLTAPVVSTPITAQRMVQQNRLTPSGGSHLLLKIELSLVVRPLFYEDHIGYHGALLFSPTVSTSGRAFVRAISSTFRRT